MLLNVSIIFSQPSSVTIEEGEFPIGGLWGVCIETAATITSERTCGNKKVRRGLPQRQDTLSLGPGGHQKF
jgi:hypothetical protein